MLQGFVSASSTGKVLDILKKQYKKYPNKKISTEDTGKMADFVLKNNLFTIKFTYEKSKEKINFPDVVKKIKDGRMITDLYCKHRDGHQQLHHDSCHADHLKGRSYLVKHSD